MKLNEPRVMMASCFGYFRNTTPNDDLLVASIRGRAPTCSAGICRAQAYADLASSSRPVIWRKRGDSEWGWDDRDLD